jgi:hypothetical protein
VARETLGLCLRGIEPDLNSAGVERVKGSVAQDRVAEGFQQAAGEILQATKELYGRPSILGRHIAQQAADL